jgi:hypothetical protein
LPTFIFHILGIILWKVTIQDFAGFRVMEVVVEPLCALTPRYMAFLKLVQSCSVREMKPYAGQGDGIAAPARVGDTGVNQRRISSTSLLEAPSPEPLCTP